MGTLTACRIARISFEPLARIPAAPPCTAARTKRAIARGSRNALPSYAWQDTIRRPRRSDSKLLGDFIQSPYPVRKHANNGLPRLRRMESQNQDPAVRTGHLLLNSS